jgi:YggT family protein
VSSLLNGFDLALGFLRLAFFGLAAVAAVVCVADWAARTRRISPFGVLARSMRRYVDPMIAPVEQRIVRAGGVPASAPFWALGAVVIGGIVILSALGFVRDQVAMVFAAAGMGGRGIMFLLVRWTFAILQIALLVRVLSSWFRISPFSPWVRWAYAITEPILRPLRQVVPTIGMIDITPIVAYFLLYLLESFVMRLL